MELAPKIQIDIIHRSKEGWWTTSALPIEEMETDIEAVLRLASTILQ